MKRADAIDLHHFALWQEEEPDNPREVEHRPWGSWEDFLRWRRDRIERPSLDLQADDALHEALANAALGLSGDLFADGFTFYPQDGIDLALPLLGAPCRASKQYGKLLVECEFDIVSAGTARIVKLLGTDLGESLAELCHESYLWRLVLDATGLDTFEFVFIEGWSPWNDAQLPESWENWERNPKDYMLSSISRITQHRYPELHDHCEDLAERYLEASGASPELVEEA
jgi:hypothetical protein